MGIDRHEHEHRNWRWPKPTEKKQSDLKNREKDHPSILPTNDFETEDSKVDEKAD